MARQRFPRLGRQARGQGTDAVARTEPHRRRPRARREVPAARHGQLPASRCRRAGRAGAGDGERRPQRHDQLHRQCRQAGTRGERHDQGDLARRRSRRPNVAIDATVNDYVSAPAVSGRVRAATVTSGKTVVRDIDVTLTRDGSWTGFDGGATVSDIPARASGRVQVASGRTVIELASGPGDGARLGGKAGARLQDRDRRRHDDARQSRDRRRRRHRRGVGHGRLARSTSTRRCRRCRPRSPTHFAPGLDAAGHHFRHGQGDRRRRPTRRSAIRSTGRARRRRRRALPAFGAMSVTSSGDFAGGRLTFQANAADGSGLGLRGGGTVDTGLARAVARFLGRRAVLVPGAAARGVGPVADRQRRTSICRCAAPPVRPPSAGR